MQEPIRKIAVFSDRIAWQLKNSIQDKQITEFEKIHAECMRLRNLATNLEQYISLSTMDHDFEEVDLNTIVNYAYTAIFDSNEVNYIKLEAEPLPVITGHRKQLEMFFANIFKNYIHYKRPQETLKIKIEGIIIQHNSFRSIKGKYRYVDFVRIVVTGNGAGVDIKKEKIFEIARILQFKSQDFGLALCKKIIENHYGTISAESAPGIGMTFTALLPVRQ